MTPIDYRNDTWNSIQDRLVGVRMMVWEAWKQHGPGTTREVARRAGLDILLFRPRTTELFQLGFVELVPETPKQRAEAKQVFEGIYQAVGWIEVQRNFSAKKRAATDAQIQLI